MHRDTNLLLFFLGTNDLSSDVNEENILICIQTFINQLLKSPQQEVRIVGLFSLKDIEKDAVHNFNNKLKERFSAEIFPCKIVQRKHFLDSCPYHLNADGHYALKKLLIL